MPFMGFDNFQSCVVAQQKSGKSANGAAKICAYLHKKATGRWPGQSESYSDPLVIDQPDKNKLHLTVSRHVSDSMNEHERKSILFDILRCKEQDKQDVFDNLWAEIGLEYAEQPIPFIESNQDLSVYLSDIAPKLPDINLSYIVFRCNSHLGLTIGLHDNKCIIWEISTDIPVIQYMESGEIVYPVRDKFLKNKIGDIISVGEGYVQDIANISDPLLEGEAALGISTNDLHEYYLWLPTEGLSGRWTIKISEDGEWNLIHNYMFPAPFILSSSALIDDLNPLLEESGVSNICFSPELLPILENDELGKQWLSGFTPESIQSIYQKYSPPPIIEEEKPVPWTITMTYDDKWVLTSGDYTIGNIIYTASYNNESNCIEIKRNNGQSSTT